MAVTKAGETIFSAVSGRIIKQLKVRENFTSNNKKTITDIAALNQNTGWIKVSSGSNILSKDGNKTYSGPAQRFILHGGASLSKSQAKKKNVDTYRKGINFDKATSFANSGNAYNNYNDRYGLGIRPMPGITSFSLQTYNPYGTLRQADITFTVWTLDDLEQAEKLFLRPGFTCVIEFGHSVYQDNDGNLQTFGKTVNAISEDFLFSERSIKSVEEAIENKRDEAFGNYDAFFGYVSNFSYSFRPDGGYDCSMKVVSKGVILDSLLGGETSDNASIKIDDDKKANDTAIPKHKSIFHTIFRAISEYLPDPNSESGFTATLDTVLEECLENGEEIDLFARLDTQDQCKFIYADIKDPLVNQSDGNENLKATERLSYIPLRFVLDIFNKFASIYKIGDTKRKTPLIKFSLEFGNKFRTFDKHFSVIPSNVHLPKVAPTIKTPAGQVQYGMTANAADASMDDYGASGNNSDGKGTNEILNIFISTKILLSIADEVYDDGGVKDKTIIDFINGILKIINTALSDVCKLSLYYNESLNEYEIVDLHGIGKAGAVPTINVTGLKSTVENLSIQSRLSTATAAQISIAAQGSVDNYKENVRAIRNWNLGSVDRFYPTKTINPNNTVEVAVTSEEDPPGKKSLPYGGSVESFLGKDENKDLAKKMHDFFLDLRDNQSLDSNAEKDLQPSLRKMNLILYEIAQANKKGTTVRHEIPIPVELSITMKGISGMKIGQVFKINRGVLLPKYNRYGYVITGIENKLDDNKWTTEIVTQFFELDNL